MHTIWRRFLLGNTDRFVKSIAVNTQYFEPCRRVARTLLQFQLGASAEYGEVPRLFRNAETVSVKMFSRWDFSRVCSNSFKLSA